MTASVAPIPAGTPPGIVVTSESPPPVGAPDLGIKVAPSAKASKHQLVTIGDSLTHGFQSGAIFLTDQSWPVMVARAGGYDSQFLRPHYDKFGGLPLNLEFLENQLDEKYPPPVTGLRVVEAAFYLRGLLADIYHYWTDGDGASVPQNAQINHNLATFGYDLRDALSLTPETALATIGAAHENLLFPMVAHAKERASRRTLPYYVQGDPKWPAMTALQAAQAKGQDGRIDTLVVMLGANNVLGVTMDLKLSWSGPGFDDLQAKSNAGYNIWRPEHFASEYAALVAELRKIDANRVILTTVPHVTVVPLLHGIDTKTVHPDGTASRYFPYYTRPWFDTGDFDPAKDPCITGDEARVVDSTIDMYNDTIVDQVRAARNDGLDWYVFDLRTLLDRLAVRRYVEAPASPPAWWTPYPLPPELAALAPAVDVRFWQSGPGGRTQGGIIALDGIHPTTIGYSLMAHEVVNVMKAAGVAIGDVDFGSWLAHDSLIQHPPAGFDATFGALGWLDSHFEYIRHIFGAGPVTP